MKTYLFGQSRTMRLTNVIGLASAMHNQDRWPEGAPPLLYVEAEAATMPAVEYMEIVTRLLTEGGTIDLKRSIKVDEGLTTTLGKLIDHIGAIVGPDDVEVQGRLVAGDHRQMAIITLEALGHGVSYKVPYKVSKDERTELLSNTLHVLNARLADRDAIPQINRLIASGHVKTAADLKRDYGYCHGKSQYIFNKAALVRTHGIPLDDVLKVADKMAAKLLKPAKGESVAELVAAHVKGMDAPKITPIPGKDLDKLIALADSKGAKDIGAVLSLVRDKDNYVKLEELILAQAK